MQTLLNKLLFLLFIAALFFAGLWVGAAGMHFQWPAFYGIRQGFVGLSALVEQQDAIKQEVQRVTPMDVKIIQPYDDGGYIAATFAKQPAVMLMDRTGIVKHSWRMPFGTAWPKQTHVTRPVPEGLINWHDFYLYPNGDLLAVYNGIGAFPMGYGLVKMDKNSNIIWTYEANAHHYLEVDEKTGLIYVLTQAFTDEPVENMPTVRKPVVRDYVDILSAEGKRITRISLLDVLARSPFAAYLTNNAHSQDILHANQISLIRQGVQLKVPYMKPGQLLVSLRDMDAVILLDIDRQEVVQFWQGPWKKQHSAKMLPNGHFIVLDNQGVSLPDNVHYSRIIEFDPLAGREVWHFSGSRQFPFATVYAGAVDPMPNGHFLISETWGNKVFEVNRAKQVVWHARLLDSYQARYYTKSQLPFLTAP